MTASPSLGRRERKKVQLRRSVQREALRLFAEQGYEETTVEQIADAADISTTTFYRYFPAKEDAVFDDDYDPIVEQAFGESAGGSAVEAVTAAMAAVAAAVEGERETALTRLRLFASVPALRARQRAEGEGTRDLYARLIAARTGRATDDYRLQVAAAALTAAMVEASRRWAESDGEESLAALMEEAVAVLAPVLDAL